MLLAFLTVIGVPAFTELQPEGGSGAHAAREGARLAHRFHGPSVQQCSPTHSVKSCKPSCKASLISVGAALRSAICTVQVCSWVRYHLKEQHVAITSLHVVDTKYWEPNLTVLHTVFRTK